MKLSIITVAVCLWLSFTAMAPLRVNAGFGFSEPIIVNSNAHADSADDYYQWFDTDGNGVWVVVWYSFYDFGAPWNYEGDILFSRSTDDGLTWSEPTPLNEYAIDDSDVDVAPFIRRSSTGTWFVAWASENPFDGESNDYDILFSRSTDEGMTWSPAAMLNSTAVSDFGGDAVITLDTDGAGTWVATWGSTENLGGSIGWDFDVFSSRSTDDGLTWSPVSVINSNACCNSNTGYLRSTVVSGGDGKWVTVWTTRDNPDGILSPDYDIFASHSTDNGVTWSPQVPVMPDWSIDQADDGEVLGGIGPSFVSLARYGEVWIAAWASRGALGGSLGDDTDILYARSLDLGETWTVARPLNSNAAEDPTGPAASDLYPDLQVDAKGTWLCVWSTTAFAAPNYTDLNIAISRSSDDGETWTPISPLNFNQRTEKLALDQQSRVRSGANGTWLAVWPTNQLFYSGGDPDLLVSRTTDGLQPIEPPLNPDEVRDAILGKYDANGDGVLDVTDLVILLF